MSTLQAGSVADLVVSTLRDLGRMKWTDIASDLQDHLAYSLFNKEKVTFQSGYEIQKNLMYKLTAAARNVGLYEQDSYNVEDVLTTMQVPWRHSTTYYSFDRREIKMNSGAAQILDLIKAKRTAGMGSLIEKMEEDFLGLTPVSTDTKTPWGLFYWLWPTHSSGSVTDGFTGGAPRDHSTKAGINTSVYTRARHYVGTYTAITDADLVTTMRKVRELVGFKTVVKSQPGYEKGRERWVYYMNLDTLIGLETLAKNQNDQLGFDIAPSDGETVFRGNPMRWVPYWQDNFTSSDPITFVDWSCFHPVVLKGENFVEEVAKNSESHYVTTVNVDVTYNYVMNNPRKGAILVKAAGLTTDFPAT